MQTKKVTFEEVYDVFAIRIILDTPESSEKADIWRTYSMVTDFYQPNPDRLRDWISLPKANGYESLHTTVMSPTGKWVKSNPKPADGRHGRTWAGRPLAVQDRGRFRGVRRRAEPSERPKPSRPSGDNIDSWLGQIEKCSKAGKPTP